MTGPAAERWRLYARVWMVVRWADGADAVEHLNRVVDADFEHLLRSEDMRIVTVVGNPAGEAQLQVHLPVLHQEFGSFGAARGYAHEHGLADCVIVVKDSVHEAELQTYGKVPLQPYVLA